MKKGFTLVELLIAIGIVGLLASIAIFSIPSAQKIARDATRKSDLKQFQSALELYANIADGLFPSRTLVNGTVNVCADLNGKLNPDIVCSQDPDYVNDASKTYKYISNGSGNGTATATIYVLWARLESKSPTTYWVVCSTGKTGFTTTEPTTYTCPTLL